MISFISNNSCCLQNNKWRSNFKSKGSIPNIMSRQYWIFNIYTYMCIYIQIYIENTRGEYRVLVTHVTHEQSAAPARHDPCRVCAAQRTNQSALLFYSMSEWMDDILMMFWMVSSWHDLSLYIVIWFALMASAGILSFIEINVSMVLFWCFFFCFNEPWWYVLFCDGCGYCH